MVSFVYPWRLLQTGNQIEEQRSQGLQQTCDVEKIFITTLW